MVPLGLSISSLVSMEHSFTVESHWAGDIQLTEAHKLMDNGYATKVFRDVTMNAERVKLFNFSQDFGWPVPLRMA